MTPPLAKHLGSNDLTTRNNAIRSLKAFLADDNFSSLPESEMQKLWKGIFYCYWMSDDRLIQQSLASELAALLLVIKSPEPALSFLRGFWSSTLREWNGIDSHRMDKYYAIVRKYVYASFLMLIKHDWNEIMVDSYNEILSQNGGPLFPRDPRIPNSLVYHLCDIYIEELIKALKASEPCLPAPLPPLIRPFIQLMASTSSKIAFSRIEDNLFRPVASELALQDENCYEDSEEKRLQDWKGEPDYFYLCQHACTRPGERVEEKEIMRQVLLQELFKTASDPETRETNRRKLYALWREGMLDTDQPVILNAG